MIEQRMIVRTAAALNHADEDEIVGGIDPEPCAGSAIPEKGAFAVGQVSRGWIEDDGTVVAVTEAGAHYVETTVEFAGEKQCGQVIGVCRLQFRAPGTPARVPPGRSQSSACVASDDGDTSASLGKRLLARAQITRRR
jgi:hypothetical protein